MAESQKKFYFLSDLHLGASYLPDSKENERRIVRFLDSIKDDAEAIFLLGDILDYWYEYRYVVPRGYVRFFGKLAELSDSGIRIVWLKGNHDIWIYDYLPQELGIEIYDGAITEKICGKKFFLEHGDGIGARPAGFRFIRGLFRNKVCQKLFSGIHPRWTVPLAYNWSSHSRKGGEMVSLPENTLLQGLRDFAVSYHKDHPDINYFIFGHLHILKKEKISDDCFLIVLGEWIRSFSYAVMSEEGLEIRTFE